jgi:hypothetical protein
MKKTTRKATTRRAATAPPIIDPLLMALLGYIDGGPRELTFYPQAAIARRVLGGDPDRSPEVCEELFAALAANDRDDAALLDELTEGGDVPLRTPAGDVYDLLVSAVRDAQLVGAVMMFDLLKGGAK